MQAIGPVRFGLFGLFELANDRNNNKVEQLWWQLQKVVSASQSVSSVDYLSRASPVLSVPVGGFVDRQAGELKKSIVCAKWPALPTNENILQSDRINLCCRYLNTSHSIEERASQHWILPCVVAAAAIQLTKQVSQSLLLTLR